LLRELGHRARVVTSLDRVARWRCDLVVALHARRSADAVKLVGEAAPRTPLVVVLTGTDLSHDIRVDAAARRSLALADRVVVLHELAPREVPARFREKVRVIPQSASAPPRRPSKARGVFEVAVVGHLRDVKDPLRTALAARLLPASSRVRVLHAGRALEAAWEQAALREQRDNPRYRWLGELSPARAIRLIARARLFVLTSRSEGGANVLGEAAVCGTPVVASRITAARAALGDDYPALFPVGDEAALARLIARAETDARWRADLGRRLRARRPLFGEKRERAAWQALLRELRQESSPGAGRPRAR
jgi:putative glycosyltransferase (TIGR04348 family)